MVNIEYKIDTFPSCDKFQIFRVYDNTIWQVMSVPAYNIDTAESEFFDMIFDDILTTELICEELNRAEDDLNG